MKLYPLLLPLLALTFVLTGCPDDDDDAVDDDDTVESFSCDGVVAEVNEISPSDLDAMLDDKDFELINVHIPRDGEIAGTDVHIAYTETDALEDHLGGEFGAKAVLYCKTGPMSEIAAEVLVDLGYCRIYDMPSGMAGWEAEGYPLDP